jgi:hypothetical protein
MQHSITPDEFQDWRDHPITQWVFAAIERHVAKQKQGWLDATWETGATPDPLMLCELRTRADAYRAMIDTTFEGWSELNEHPDA